MPWVEPLEKKEKKEKNDTPQQNAKHTVWKDRASIRTRRGKDVGI